MSESIIQPTEKLRTIRLYGPLGTKFGREFKFVVSTPAEAIRALSTQLEGFEKFLSNAAFKYAVFIGRRRVHLNTKLEELYEPPGDGDIRIAPIIAGAKRGGLFQTLLGAALIVAAFYTGGATLAGMSTGIAGAMTSAGVGLALGGIAQLLSPQPKINLGESAENKASQYFSGPVQTIAQANPIPICYGHGLVGSVPISAGIYATNSSNYPPQTTEDTTIKMKNLDSLVGGFEANVYGKSYNSLHKHFCKHTRHQGFTAMPRATLNADKEEASPRLVQTIQAETLAVQRLNSRELFPAREVGKDIETYRLSFPPNHLAWTRIMDAWKRVPGGDAGYSKGKKHLEYSNFVMHPEALDLLRMWHGVYPETTLVQRVITLDGPVWELVK